MSATLTISDAATYVSTLLQNQRLNVNNQQPGLTMANIVLQRMLGAPFVWRFNRGCFTLSITPAGGTDYVVSVPDLGRIETQWLLATENVIWQLNGAVGLAKSTIPRRPTVVAPVYDDNAGNITFRFDSIPDGDYTAVFDYQRKAPLLTSWAKSFGPVPDEFGYIFNKWFLAEAAILVNNSLFEIWRREAVSALLATQDGLDAQAKAIFLDQMTNIGRTAARSQSAGQSGAQGRAS